MRKQRKSSNPLYDIFYGGDAYRNMLFNYFGKEDRESMVELVEFHMRDRRQVIEFMGGQENYDYLPPKDREPMFVLSVFRYLCDELDVWKPKHYSGGEKFSATGPVQYVEHE